MDILVLAGGLSTERDVSLVSGQMVAKALRAKGHRVILWDVFIGYGKEEMELGAIFDRGEEVSIAAPGITSEAPDLAAVKASRFDQSDCFFGPNVIALGRKSDIVFMALHGEHGENGKVQAALDLFGIKYTGTDYFSSAIAMNKEVAKVLFREAAIPTPKGILLRSGQGQGNSPEDAGLSYPLIVKPLSGGSSIGVTVARTVSEYQKALTEAFQYEPQVLVEEFVQGREFSVAVVEGVAYPVIEIAPVEGFYDYTNKYKAGNAVETCPADLPQSVSAEMQRYAEKAYHTLGFSTYSRFDFMLNGANDMFCLEGNSLPGMTPTSLLPQEAQAIGMGYEELCEHIIEISLKKYK